MSRLCGWKHRIRTPRLSAVRAGLSGDDDDADSDDVDELGDAMENINIEQFDSPALSSTRLDSENVLLSWRPVWNGEFYQHFWENSCRTWGLLCPATASGYGHGSQTISRLSCILARCALFSPALQLVPWKMTFLSFLKEPEWKQWPPQKRTILRVQRT